MQTVINAEMPRSASTYVTLTDEFLQYIHAINALKNSKAVNCVLKLSVHVQLRDPNLDILTFNVILYLLHTQIHTHRYVHRVGRTARAGCGGRAVTFVGDARRKVMKDVLKSDTSDTTGEGNTV